MSKNRRRVVVTGLGVISPVGIGKEAFWDSLVKGKSGIKRISKFDASEYPCQVAGEVDDFDPLYAVGEPLLRRPRHQASLSARLGFPRWSAAATLVHVAERADSDFVGLGLTSNAAHTRLGARVHVRIAGPLEAWLVAENLTDARYQEVLGYPALGRSLRGGLRLAVGGANR